MDDELSELTDMSCDEMLSEKEPDSEGQVFVRHVRSGGTVVIGNVRIRVDSPEPVTLVCTVLG